MSADNWRRCPRCLKEAEQKQKAAALKAKRAYGKVSEEDYERLVMESRQPVEVETEFREDYEIGVSEDGEFYVNYGGTCAKCGFSHSFTHSQMLDSSPGKGGAA